MSMRPNSLRVSSSNTGVAGVGSALAHAAEAAAAAAEAQGWNGRTSIGFTKKQKTTQLLLRATLQEINISHLGKKKIIDSNMPLKGGYVNSLEGYTP